MIHTSLYGRVVLVTVANHGIVAATAKALEPVSARVFLNFLRTPLCRDRRSRCLLA
jgi:hypothetical protein